MVESALADEVLSALQRNPYLTGRKLHFEAEHGRVVLRGVVGSYYQKQMAQELLRKLKGVEEIENQLQVDWR